MTRILIIVGSLRERSFNRRLAARAAQLLEGRAEVAFLDYAAVPFVNQDAEFPPPVEVARVREDIAAADGIWIFSPEYNHSYPGALKNLLDWASRPQVRGDYATTAIRGKKVALSGVAGGSGAADVMDHLTELLDRIKADVMEAPRTGVKLSAEAFKSDELVLSAEDEAALARQAEAFLGYLETEC